MMTDLFSNISLWEVLGWTMLHFMWMGCIALAASAAVRWCVRRCAAELRYFAAVLCLLGVSASAAAALSVALRHVSGDVAGATASVTPTAEPAAAGAPPLPIDWMEPGRLRTAPQIQPAVRQQTAQEAFQQWVFDGTLNAIARLLPWLWVCGTPLVALALLTGIIGATRLRRRSTTVTDEPLRQQLHRLRTLLGIPRRVGIAVCDQVSSPLVIGIVRPLIILPPALISGLAPAQLEMILLHELAHVRRWDNLVNLLQRAIEALFFYHPAVWWASRWVRLEREHCCDALVLAHNHTPQSYAETLATLALPELAPQFATAAMANHQLTSRICHILNVEERTMTVSIRTLIGGVVLLATGVGGFLLATLRAERAAADDPVPAAASGSEPAASEPEGRLLFGVGVNSDAGVAGNIVYEDGGEPIEELLGLGADDGHTIGESLATWGRHAWSANEATGMPNVPQAGDSEHAWASLTKDGQPEWLRLTFDAPVNAAAIMVYESFNPGALTRMTTVDSEGAEVVLWEGKDPVAAQDERGVAIVILHDVPALTEVTLHLDSPAVPGWNEIDAVGLIDRVTGEVHWADGAEASSSYAEHSEHRDFVANPPAVSQCQKCHTVDLGFPGHPPQNPRQRIEQLRRELQRLEIELEHEEALRAQAEAEAQQQLDQAQRQLLENWINAANQPPQPDQDPDAAADEDVGWEFLNRDFMLNKDLDPDRFFEQLDRNGDGQLSKDELEFLVGGSEADGEPRQRTPYRDRVLELLNKPAAGTPEEDSRFEELNNTVREQQQAIERLTNILEELRQRLESTDHDAAEPEAGAEGLNLTVPPTGPAPLALDFAFPSESRNAIDELVRQRLKDSGLEESGEMTDEEFIRRLYLDLLGRVPTDEEIQQFQQDESADARTKLIDRLLNSADAQTQLYNDWSVFFGIQR